MELVHGASLATVLNEASTRGRLEPGAWLQALIGADTQAPAESDLRLAVRWAAEVAEGLVEAHNNGVIHRDIKPSNILIRAGSGSPYSAVLIDFGIAARAGDLTLTATRTSIGTPWYMPPEQARGDERSQPTLDVYALCATLHHMITGRPPYDGETAVEVIAKLQQEDPVPARSIRPEVSADLQAILDKGLDRDPRRRYQAMDLLRDDLRAFLELRTVSARPLSPIGRFVRRVRYRPVRYAAIALGILLVLTLGIAIAVTNQNRRYENDRLALRMYRELPALLAIEGQAHERLLVPLQEREAALANLSTILAVYPDHHATRLFRAALCTDLGRHQLARSDLAYIGRNTQDPFLGELVHRYENIAPSARGAGAVAFRDLPSPTTPVGHLVAGFHELRARDGKEDPEVAYGHFQSAIRGMDGSEKLMARDLGLIASVAYTISKPKEERGPLLNGIIEETYRLEGAYGQPTQRTLALRGAALILLKRYQRAIEPLEKAVAMRADRHGPLLNLGICYKRTDRDAEALAHVEAACKLRPHFFNSQYTRAQLLRDTRRFDDALTLANRLADTAPPGYGNAISKLVASIERAAFDASKKSEAEARPAVANAFETASRNALSQREARYLATQQALLDPDRTPTSKITILLEHLETNPADTYELADLVRRLGATAVLDDEALYRLRKWISALALHINPEDAMLRKEITKSLSIKQTRAREH